MSLFSVIECSVMGINPSLFWNIFTIVKPKKLWSGGISVCGMGKAGLPKPSIVF